MRLSGRSPPVKPDATRIATENTPKECQKDTYAYASVRERKDESES